jgi:hypothetical protein
MKNIPTFEDFLNEGKKQWDGDSYTRDTVGYTLFDGTPDLGTLSRLPHGPGGPYGGVIYRYQNRGINLLVLPYWKDEKYTEVNWETQLSRSDKNFYRNELNKIENQGGGWLAKAAKSLDLKYLNLNKDEWVRGNFKDLKFDGNRGNTAFRKYETAEDWKRVSELCELIVVNLISQYQQ